MISNISAANILNLGNVVCGGNVNLNKLEQINIIKQKINNEFTLNVTNEISRQIHTSISSTYAALYDTIIQKEDKPGLTDEEHDALRANMNIM